LVVRAINRRIAEITGTVIEQGEPLSVLHYSPGQQYHPHLDALPGVTNQRVRTVLIYLNQGYGGGATVFSANNLHVQGQAGDAVVFDNCWPDGRIKLDSRHAGLPVTQGTKWLATRWIRAKPYDPWA
jgi:prolyl 4-hydroxylase